jgi:hypothetical protein
MTWTRFSARIALPAILIHKDESADGNVTRPGVMGAGRPAHNRRSAGLAAARSSGDRQAFSGLGSAVVFGGRADLGQVQHGRPGRGEGRGEADNGVTRAMTSCPVALWRLVTSYHAAP